MYIVFDNGVVSRILPIAASSQDDVLLLAKYDFPLKEKTKLPCLVTRDQLLPIVPEGFILML